jgi:serine/threonine protein phosphatase PrpC
VIYHCNADYDTAMGSTLTAALVHNHRLYVAHVGDSRAYHFNVKQGLRRITNDHTLAGDLVAANLLHPDKIYQSAKRNQHNRYLGNAYHVQVDLFQQDVARDDLIVLCTDGLWHMVRDERIADFLTRTNDLNLLAHLLIESANSNGGEGNASAIVMRVM